MKIRLLGISIIIVLLSASCNKGITPAKNTDNTVRYDSAAFERIYVEAIKQKLIGNPGDALKYFEQSLKINPHSDGAYYQMAQILAASGDINSAKKFALNAVSLDQKNLWYLMMVSQLYYQDKNLDSAIIWYQKAVNQFPDNENIQLALGNLYVENQDYGKANNIFDNFDKKYGVNESSTILSIRSLMATGNYKDAKVKAEELLKQKPDDVLYNGVYAEILSDAGEPDKAMTVYNKLLNENKSDPNVQLSLADFFLKQKKYDDLFAILNALILNSNIRKEDKMQFFAGLVENEDLLRDKRLEMALMVLEAANNDDDVIPLLRPEMLVKQGKLQEAANRLEQIIKERPADYYAWEKLLLVYVDLKDWEKLTTRAEQCASMFNMSFLAKLLYANGAIETGKYDTALVELKKAEILANDNKDYMTQILTMRADVYYRQKDYEKAFATFEEALKTNNDDIMVMNNYAYYLAEQNMNLKEAEELAKKVVSKDKNNATYLDTYGWVLYKRGKTNEAAKIFESIINAGNKPDAEWYEHFGFVLKKQNKCKKAIEYWNKALELDKTKSNLIEEIKSCEK